MVSAVPSSNPSEAVAFDPHTLSRFFTPVEAAERLRVSPATLAAWRTGRGGIYGPPYAKIGGRVLYRECDLEAFVDSQMKRHTGS